MRSLYSLLSRLDSKSLSQAPARNENNRWGQKKSPYKPALILAFIVGSHDKKRKKKNQFRRGIVRYDEIQPIFDEVLELIVPDISKIDTHAAVQPFWRLGAGQPKIWDLMPADGATTDLVEAICNTNTNIVSPKKLNSLVSCAEFSTSDFELLSDRLGATIVCRFLIGEYFRDNPNALQLLDFVSPAR